MLKNYLEENDELPLRILNYVTSVVNYGGRITDAQDIRIADTILNTYYREEALVDGFSMSEDGIWKMPNDSDFLTLEDVRKFITTMPMEASPTVFGLHENEQKQRASSRAAAGQQRISVAVGLRRLVGAISLAAFTDGLASAGGDAASKVPAMDGTMMGEVARTAGKIGHDIGDGISVPNGVRRCPNPALPKTLC